MKIFKTSLWLGVIVALLLGSSAVGAAPKNPTVNLSTQTGTDDDIAAITAVVEAMQAAVLDQDVDLYMSYVDLSDANFATEHANWANDWGEDDYLTTFTLDIADLEFLEDGRAIGELTFVYATSYDHQPGATAIFPVQFTYDEENETWLYAGEYWITTDTDHFLVHAAPGLEDVVDVLIPDLPAIYDGVTADYGHEPVAPMEIKLYASRPALWATVLLSLPPYTGWNEPNESLKLFAGDSSILTTVVAHEFTHFLSFDQANQGQPLMPWWLLEGIAQAMAVPFDARGIGGYDQTVLNVRAASLATGLVPWQDIADFKETPTDYWQYVYPQGYTFTRFVTDVYGADLRNEWIALQALEMDINEATEAVFEMTFEQLDAGFLIWLEDFEIE
jgi:hypothetical protein